MKISSILGIPDPILRSSHATVRIAGNISQILNG